MCPIAIADLVLQYNRAMEGLYSKVDALTFDLFAGFPGMAVLFIPFCKAFEKSLRTSVLSHRVIAVNEEQPTCLGVAGFITVWKTNSKDQNTTHPSRLTIELQFLENH